VIALALRKVDTEINTFRNLTGAKLVTDGRFRAVAVTPIYLGMTIIPGRARGSSLATAQPLDADASCSFSWPMAGTFPVEECMRHEQFWLPTMAAYRNARTAWL